MLCTGPCECHINKRSDICYKYQYQSLVGCDVCIHYENNCLLFQDPVADGEVKIKSAFADLNEQIQESFRKLED